MGINASSLTAHTNLHKVFCYVQSKKLKKKKKKKINSTKYMLVCYFGSLPNFSFSQDKIRNANLQPMRAFSP